MEKTTIFICYSKEDEKWKKLLVKQLDVLQQYYDTWTEGEIKGGEDRLEKLEEAIRAARVAIFLVSSDSLNSQFLGREDVASLLERQKEDLRVIPLIVKDCAYQFVAWIARTKVRPEDEIPLRKKKAADVDTELVKLVKEVSKIIGSSASALTGSQRLGEPQNRAPSSEPPTTPNEKSRQRRDKLRRLEEQVAALKRELGETGGGVMTKATPSSAMPSEHQGGELPPRDLPKRATGEKPQFLKD